MALDISANIDPFFTATMGEDWASLEALLEMS